MPENPEKIDQKAYYGFPAFLKKLDQFLSHVDPLDTAHRGINSRLIPRWLEAGFPLSRFIEDSGYGETPRSMVPEVFQGLLLQPGDIFLDLGCGLNWLAGWLSQYRIQAYGIERNPLLCDLARQLSEWTDSEAELLEGDFLTMQWPSANKIYSATQRLNDATLLEMSEKIQKHQPARMACCLGKPLPGLEAKLSSTSLHPIRWNAQEEILETHLYLYQF